MTIETSKRLKQALPHRAPVFACCSSSWSCCSCVESNRSVLAFFGPVFDSISNDRHAQTLSIPVRGWPPCEGAHNEVCNLSGKYCGFRGESVTKPWGKKSLGGLVVVRR